MLERESGGGGGGGGRTQTRKLYFTRIVDQVQSKPCITTSPCEATDE